MGIGEVIAGGASQLIGSMYQDYRNRKAVDRAQDYATGMSNTAYQRAVKDLRKAGLNPMLAYTQGGASTPQGEMLPTSAPDMAKGAATAMETKMIKANIEKVGSEIAVNAAVEKAQKAAAIRDTATARAANANAEMVEADIPRAREAGKINKTLAPVDAVIDRAAKGIGAVMGTRQMLQVGPSRAPVPNSGGWNQPKSGKKGSYTPSLPNL